MLIRHAHKIAGVRNRVLTTAAGLFVPAFDAFLPKHNNAFALIRPAEGEGLIIPGYNIITDAGDVHIAQSAAGETPTNDFDVFELCSAGTPGKSADRSDFTPINDTEKAFTGGYPKTDDDDTDNSGGGADIVTRAASYAKGDFNASGISHAIITNATPGASEPIYTGYAWAAPFDKTADDTLKVFHNTEHNGVSE